MPKLLSQAAMDLTPVSASTIYNNPNLSTAIVQLPDPATVGVTVLRRVCLTNKHPTQGVAFLLSSACVSFAASAAGAIATNEGVPVLPGSQFFFNYYCSPSTAAMLHLYAVASAGSTPFQATFFDTPVGNGA